MEHEAALDIAEDTMRDDAALTPHDKRYHGLGATEGRCDCPECVMARLCDRQRDAITKLTEELEVERGRNRVLGFQIRTLRGGK